MKYAALATMVLLLAAQTGLAFDPDTQRDVQVTNSPALEAYADSLNDKVPCGGKGRVAKHAMYLRLRGSAETEAHQRHDRDDADAPAIIHNAYLKTKPQTSNDVIMFTVETNIACMKKLKLLP